MRNFEGITIAPRGFGGSASWRRPAVHPAAEALSVQDSSGTARGTANGKSSKAGCAVLGLKGAQLEASSELTKKLEL